jgi:N-ethylmaleimide reductase
VFGGTLILNSDYVGRGASGWRRRADAISFGRPFIANPDLVERLRQRPAAGRPGPAHLLHAGTRRLHRLSRATEQAAA